MSANQEIKTTQLNSIIESNKEHFKSIKTFLNLMKSDIDSDVEKNQAEPETRVKKTVHRTFTQKFRDVLRMSQSIQTEFKNAVQNRIKKQLKLIVDEDMTEEDLNDLAADPAAAQQLMQQQVMGQAHSKMKNTVSDIEEKYRAILKLEESVNELFELFQELATLVQQ